MQPLRSICSLLLCAGLCAQSATFLQPGHVVHAFGGGAVALMDTGLQTLTPLQVVPAGLNVNKLTWDPLSSDDLIVAASDNMIYRSSVSAGGVTITPFSPQAIAGVRQLSWDQNGDLLVVGLSQGDVITRVDRLTGVATPVLSWPLTQITCGLQNPTNGDYFVGNTQGIWRVTGVPSGTPSVTLVAPTPTSVSSMAFDALQPRFLLFTRSQDLYRLDVTTLVVEPVWTGVQGIDLIRTSHAGDFRAVRSRDVFSQQNPAIVPAGGSPPVLIGANASIGCCNLADAVVVGQTYEPFHLQITSDVGCGATFVIDNPPVGTSTTWMFFSGTTTFPVGTGPFFGLMPDGVTLLLLDAFAAPAPGSFLHSIGPPLQTTVLPPGILCFLSGQTWDVVVAAWGPTLQFAGRTNVQRLTWQ